MAGPRQHGAGKKIEKAAILCENEDEIARGRIMGNAEKDGDE